MGKLLSITIYIVVISIFLSGCATSKSKINTLDKEISKLVEKEIKSKSDLSKALKTKNKSSRLLTYLKSKEGSKTFVGGSCVLPLKSGYPPNKCSSDLRARESVAPICTSVAFCINRIGEGIEFKKIEGQTLRNIVRSMANGLGNLGSTLFCSDLANLGVSQLDASVALGSGFLNTKLDDLITGGFSVVSCTTSLSNQCRNQYSVWEDEPYRMQKRCNLTTQEYRQSGLNLSELEMKYELQIANENTKRIRLADIQNELRSLRSARSSESAKIKPRKAGDVVISF